MTGVVEQVKNLTSKRRNILVIVLAFLNTELFTLSRSCGVGKSTWVTGNHDVSAKNYLFKILLPYCMPTV